jgi:hypothetical protein
MMRTPLNLLELSIVVLAKNHNPTILNNDFLLYNKIIPEGWELAERPICLDPMAQIKYKNQVSIVAQFDKIIFTEVLVDKGIEAAVTPDISIKYIHTLPHVNYSAVGVNLKGHVELNDMDGPRRYILENVIASGPWSDFGKQPVNASVKFSYDLEKFKLTLSIDSADFQVPRDKNPKKVLLFNSNFHTDLKDTTKEGRVEEIIGIINGWKECYSIYKTLVDKVFFQEA